MTGVNTHDAAYLIFGNFFKHLPDTHLDVAFGLVGLFVLYAFRFGTAYLGKKYPKYDKLWFFINIMRNGVVVIFGTLIGNIFNIYLIRHSEHILIPFLFSFPYSDW